jgi:hypothetical protein
MSATQRALAVSFFVLCFSFGISMFNEYNLDYILSMGHPFVIYSVTPMIEYSQINVGTNQAEFNATVNQYTNFQKPENINFNFDFFKSIDIARLLYNTLVSTVWGFPFYLGALGMPSILVLPMLIMMEISHLLVLVYLIVGKSF